MMQTIAATAERLASDSIQTIIQDNERNTADSTMILQSIQREEASEPTLYFEKHGTQNRRHPLYSPLHRRG